MGELRVGSLLCIFLVAGSLVVAAGRGGGGQQGHGNNGGHHGQGSHGNGGGQGQHGNGGGQGPHGNGGGQGHHGNGGGQGSHGNGGADDHDHGPEGGHSEPEENGERPGHKRWNESFTPPANCPHRYNDTNLCSTLYNFTWPEVSFRCCSNEEGEREIDSDDMDEHEDSAEAEGLTCDRICIAIRNVTMYTCITDCCEGYQRSENRTCHNKTNSMDCLNGGTKVATWYGSYCQCMPGFKGKTCDKPICFCQNNGSCVVKNNKPKCSCKEGFYGDHCELHTCGLTCHNGGTCVSNGWKEVCNCTLPYVGKYCMRKHIDSELCPAAPPRMNHTGECRFYCDDDDECLGDEVCCRDGCNLFCKKPKNSMCTMDRRTFALGQSYQPTPCKSCTCVEPGQMKCTEIMHCPQIMCAPGYTLTTPPGECCQQCSDTPSTPPVIKCPKRPITLEIKSKTVVLTKENTYVTAYDSKKQPLPVSFDPYELSHCACADSRYKYNRVMAKAMDTNGGISSCSFDAYIIDVVPPTITACPEDIYIFEGEMVQWVDPRISDNSGIAGMKCNREYKGKRLIAGTYRVEIRVWDYERNIAICRFNITVSKQDTPIDQLPEGHRERAHGKSKEFKYAIVIGPIVGAVGLFALVIAICICMRTRRTQRMSQYAAPTPRQQNYDNNIYHLPNEVKLTPPPYTLPSNPPVYSSTNDLKEGDYAYISPPTYTESVTKEAESYINPGYETLGTKSDV